MNSEQKVDIINTLKNIKLTDITRIYSGRVGCMCGCKGIYRDSEDASRVLNNMIKFTEKTPSDSLYVDNCSQYFYVEHGNKCYCIYRE